MSKDDIEVIEYKILKYLYESIKAGTEQRSARLPGIASFSI